MKREEKKKKGFFPYLVGVKKDRKENVGEGALHPDPTIFSPSNLERNGKENDIKKTNLKLPSTFHYTFIKYYILYIIPLFHPFKLTYVENMWKLRCF